LKVGMPMGFLLYRTRSPHRSRCRLTEYAHATPLAWLATEVGTGSRSTNDLPVDLLTVTVGALFFIHDSLIL